MTYCLGIVYVTFFLQEQGITAGTIGILTALCGFLSAFLQGWMGTLADKGGLLNWKNLLLALISGNLAVCSFLTFLKSDVILLILFGSFILLINSMMPLVNAACFYYNQKEVPIEFGSARAVGSLTFAAISVIIGKLTVAYGAVSIAAAGAAVNALMLLTVFSLPYYGDPTSEEKTFRESAKEEKTFVSRYPKFVLMLLGLSLLMAFHNSVQTYMLMIIENIGGNSDNLGTAVAIAAIMELFVLFRFSLIRRKFKTETLLLASGVFYCLRGVLYLLASSLWHIYLIQTLQALTFAIYASASTYYADEVMAKKDKATGQGLMTVTLTAGIVIGNLQGGLTYDAYGVHWMMGIALVFAALGTMLILASMLRKKPTLGPVD